MELGYTDHFSLYRIAHSSVVLLKYTFQKNFQKLLLPFPRSPFQCQLYFCSKTKLPYMRVEHKTTKPTGKEQTLTNYLLLDSGSCLPLSSPEICNKPPAENYKFLRVLEVIPSHVFPSQQDFSFEFRWLKYIPWFSYTSKSNLEFE